jgi:hypothetical protein
MIHSIAFFEPWRRLPPRDKLFGDRFFIYFILNIEFFLGFRSRFSIHELLAFDIIPGLFGFVFSFDSTIILPGLILLFAFLPSFLVTLAVAGSISVVFLWSLTIGSILIAIFPLFLLSFGFFFYSFCTSGLTLLFSDFAILFSTRTIFLALFFFTWFTLPIHILFSIVGLCYSVQSFLSNLLHDTPIHLIVFLLSFLLRSTRFEGGLFCLLCNALCFSPLLFGLKLMKVATLQMKRRKIFRLIRCFWVCQKVPTVQSPTGGESLSGIELQQLFQEIQCRTRHFGLILVSKFGFSGRLDRNFPCAEQFEVLKAVPRFLSRCAHHVKDELQLIHLCFPRKQRLSQNQLGQNTPCTPNVDRCPVSCSPQENLWWTVPESDHLVGEFEGVAPTGKEEK